MAFRCPAHTAPVWGGDVVVVMRDSVRRTGYRGPPVPLLTACRCRQGLMHQPHFLLLVGCDVRGGVHGHRATTAHQTGVDQGTGRGGGTLVEAVGHAVVFI